MTNSLVNEICTKCNGTGKLSTRYSTDDCWLCKGTGLLPNKFGREILELINIYNNPFYMNHLRSIKD